MMTYEMCDLAWQSPWIKNVHAEEQRHGFADAKDETSHLLSHISIFFLVLEVRVLVISIH
jgi:hypothetical protein